MGYLGWHSVFVKHIYCCQLEFCVRLIKHFASLCKNVNSHITAQMNFIFNLNIYSTRPFFADSFEIQPITDCRVVRVV